MDVPVGLIHQMVALEDCELFEFSTQHFDSDSHRLVKGGPPVAVRIYYGAPVVDGERLDRAPRWCAVIDGRTDRLERDADGNVLGRVPIDAFEVWPECSARRVDVGEYRFLLRLAAWARRHKPAHPAARPFERIDLRALEPRF